MAVRSAENSHTTEARQVQAHLQKGIGPRLNMHTLRFLSEQMGIGKNQNFIFRSHDPKSCCKSIIVDSVLENPADAKEKVVKY